MVALIESAWLAKAIHVAVTLDIPDLLKAGPKQAHELSAATGTETKSLHRIMRALAAVGIFDADERQRFSLTSLGATLRADVPGSLHDWALLMLGTVHQEAWGDVLHSVCTGESAFQHRYGMNLWQYRARHPDYAKVFDAAMAGFTMTYVETLLNSYSFSNYRKIVDVGGGDGSLLIGILQRCPNADGIVYDLPDVADRARQRISAAGLGDRCVVVAGDAFVVVPAGADAYVLSRVLHDWDDDQARQILMSCRNVLKADGRVLVIERTMPDDLKEIASARSSVIAEISMTDLNMMVMTSGRERTPAEYQALFGPAGLELVRIVQTETGMNVMELATV
jgi:ubiquinone/menaquinone biosynthesis C-methylase UbiE